MLNQKSLTANHYHKQNYHLIKKDTIVITRVARRPGSAAIVPDLEAPDLATLVITIHVTLFDDPSFLKT